MENICQEHTFQRNGMRHDGGKNICLHTSHNLYGYGRMDGDHPRVIQRRVQPLGPQAAQRLRAEANPERNITRNNIV